MARPRSKTDMTCRNRTCEYFLKEQGKDILKRGKNSAGHQRYYCNHCDKWFVETTNTPLYRKQLSEGEIIRICELLVEKKGIRSIERITGHHRDTISRLIADMAKGAEKMNEYLMEEMDLTPAECVELWSFVKMKKIKLSEAALAELEKVMRDSK